MSEVKKPKSQGIELYINIEILTIFGLLEENAFYIENRRNREITKSQKCQKTADFKT